MIRDPGPIVNLGNGVMSRDLPLNEGETEGISPNSGYISRALGDHPIMRFVAAGATTMVVAGVLSRMTKKGGLKLTKFAEEKFGTNALGSSAIHTAKQIRRHLDELQGVRRYIEDEQDVYGKLVFEEDGNLTTGYNGITSEDHRFPFLTDSERKAAKSAALMRGENVPAVWSYKDEVQKRLIRAGRRLPYELPAFYIAQKAVVDPLFGERTDPSKKVNWYNPVDVITDFTTESVKSIATMILPFEGLGAAASSTRAGLHSVRYGAGSVKDLSPLKQKLHKSFVNVNEVLGEVGHDFATVTNKVLKKTAQTTGAFNAASLEFQAQQIDITTAYHRLRHGRQAAIEAARTRGASREAIKKIQFTSLFAKPDGIDADDYASVFDLVPAFRGLSAAASAGKKEYKLLGNAQNVIDKAISYDRLANPSFTKDELTSAINRLQEKHSSRLSKLAKGIRILGGGGPGNTSLPTSEFGIGQQRDAFKTLLVNELNEIGIDKADAIDFVKQLKIGLPKAGASADKIVTIGKTKILDELNPADTASESFFGTLIKRFEGIKKSESVINGLGRDTASRASALQQAIDNASATFTSRRFKDNLDNTIKKNWNKFYRDDLHNVASTVLKPKKAVYQDFIGEPTAAKLEFLQRKTAQTLGIKLVDDNSRILSNDIITGKLAARGIDPLNFTDLRAFLIENRKMTSGVLSGGLNLFGLEQVTIDEANQRGMFKYLPKAEQDIIVDLAGRTAIKDPVSASIGLSRLDGVYKTKSGEILDFTSIKSSIGNVANFFASEFKIPLLGFNPVDLFGYNSYSAMARRSPIQYVSSFSVQPFIHEAKKPVTGSSPVQTSIDSARQKLLSKISKRKTAGTSASSGMADMAPTVDSPDFYIWHKTKGTKGSLTGYFSDESGSTTYSRTLAGSYRAIPTNSTDLLTRHTRYASDLEGRTTEEIRGETSSNFLNRLLGPERALEFKSRFRVDPEQPNSMFGAMRRFVQRGYDMENPVTMARLFSGESINYRGGVKARLDIIDDALRLVDDTSGEIIEDVSESQVLRGVHTLAKETFQTGLPRPIMARLEENAPELFQALGKRVTQLGSETELVRFGQELIDSLPSTVRRLRDMGLDPTQAETAISRISNLLDQSNFNSASMLSKRSPTISTRLDELRNEIFRYVAQSNQMLRPDNPTQIFTEMSRAIDDLVASGRISSSQRIEAQAAGLSTLFNMSAFKTFSDSDSVVESARKAAVETFRKSSSSADVSSLFSPFASGNIVQVTGGSRKRFAPLLSTMKRNLGTARYQPDDLAIDPLGSGQGVTMVPTFGTVFGRNPFGAIQSALGINTYSSPESFSTASIPVSQGVERLNRYFGTVGLQLDVSRFSGPLSLFTKGMVGQRVLPMYAAGVTALTIDRTLGGMVYGKDENDERIYAPLVLGQVAKGAVEIQSLMSGLTPGGMTYQEKKEQLVEGEVPIRQGRYWPLGNTPFKGGKIMYYRPSWYRKLQGGALFTSDTYGSPAEKFLFYNDISPLRPFDPYRFERKHFADRPYPVSGEYFTGPFGPITPLGNLTIGRILKPQIMMHQKEVETALASYAPAGEFGAYDANAYTAPSMSSAGGGFDSAVSSQGGYSGSVAQGRPFSGGGIGAGQVSAYNNRFASMAGPTNTANQMVRTSLSDVNTTYSSMSYGPPKVSKVMQPRIVPAGPPISAGGMEFQAGEFGFKTQEMLGIYGFAFGSIRQKFGLGQSDLEPQRAVLQSASKGYGSTRAFWDLNLGGLGDVPLPSSEGIGNIEFSEIIRRFIPKERSGVDYINPIRNTMGKQYPWLPGPEYYINFQTGDPFTRVQEGEVRLPGVGYERFNRLNPDETGEYGLIDQLNILGDVAPYSQQYKSVNARLKKMNLSPDERIKVAEIQQQVEDTTTKFDFSPYKYRYSSSGESLQSPISYGVKRAGEYVAHLDNFVINKTIGKTTAVEDWERKNVYGTTFPQWQNPVESYLTPMVNKATQRNPIVAAAALGVAGSFFGRTPKARLFGTVVGSVTGFTASLMGSAREFISGERYIPMERKKELAVEEHADILNYVKNTRLANMSRQSGDMKAASQFTAAAKRTMYGADLDNPNLDMLALAIPKRKREHFKSMIQAPVEERERILSTAPRLERRFYEAAWGMQVEQKPDLVDYFTRHELPDDSWEGWHPNTNIDHVKIKTGQSLGLDMSQMGYYPQQIKEANLSNPSYPQFFSSSGRQDTSYRLKRLMDGMGISGTITPVSTPFGSQSLDITAGVG